MADDTGGGAGGGSGGPKRKNRKKKKSGKGAGPAADAPAVATESPKKLPGTITPPEIADPDSGTETGPAAAGAGVRHSSNDGCAVDDEVVSSLGKHTRSFSTLEEVSDAPQEHKPRLQSPVPNRANKPETVVEQPERGCAVDPTQIVIVGAGVAALAFLLNKLLR